MCIERNDSNLNRSNEFVEIVSIWKTRNFATTHNCSYYQKNYDRRSSHVLKRTTFYLLRLDCHVNIRWRVVGACSCCGCSYNITNHRCSTCTNLFIYRSSYSWWVCTLSCLNNKRFERFGYHSRWIHNRWASAFNAGLSLFSKENYTKYLPKSMAKLIFNRCAGHYMDRALRNSIECVIEIDHLVSLMSSEIY